MKTIVLAWALMAGAALGEEAPEPYRIAGGWATCPYGYLISHGRCWPWREGPIVEYGGDPDRPWVGNVGSPSAGFATPAQSFGSAIGLSVFVGR